MKIPVYGKPFVPSIKKERCSDVISYLIKWNDLKIDWKLIIRCKNSNDAEFKRLV